ncbi:YnbE family lipoprotein [Halopseudomonas laoshanensis]|uniref:YnbE family lipoprotein n=1 Tax=Halopseudomonas laoshanensis TaxID=2268758 RepID=A0A7V7GTE4_9GAMM|nr:YnbE family lipoprotein [Halopseudomonas laoshanensis]KAA0694284.1 YnbE family lipoprotein [Halopseudomonas laoshanensis]WOD11591.1 YnbE family lipoprotein [Pseudomonas sp. NyZ704]
MRWRLIPVTAVAFWLLAGCTPTVQLAAPNEPININLNVKIQHEIYIKVDKQLDELFSESSGLF